MNSKSDQTMHVLFIGETGSKSWIPMDNGILEQGKGSGSFPCPRLWNKEPEPETILGLLGANSDLWEIPHDTPYPTTRIAWWPTWYGGPQKQTDPGFCGSSIIVIRPSSSSYFYFWRGSLASFSPRSSSLSLTLSLSLFLSLRHQHPFLNISDAAIVAARYLAPRITNGIITSHVQVFDSKILIPMIPQVRYRIPPFCSPHGLSKRYPVLWKKKKRNKKVNHLHLVRIPYKEKLKEKCISNWNYLITKLFA